jgi:acetyltransferase-like isoleucine patch superfamily enzyme
MKGLISALVTMREKFLFAVFQRPFLKKFPDAVIFPGVYISSSSNLGKHSVVHENVRVIDSDLGDYSYTFSTISNMTIGKFCSIGPRCIFGLVSHPTRTFVSTYPGFFSKNNKGCLISFSNKDHFPELPERIVIGNDVWIGSNCIIMDGVKIGNGAVIGAGAVVTKDVDDFAIMGGVPAKVIRYRFTKAQIECLNKIKWWDKNIEWITQRSELFLNIEKFCSSELNDK